MSGAASLSPGGVSAEPASTARTPADTIVETRGHARPHEKAKEGPGGHRELERDRQPGVHDLDERRSAEHAGHCGEQAHARTKCPEPEQEEKDPPASRALSPAPAPATASMSSVSLSMALSNRTSFSPREPWRRPR